MLIMTLSLRKMWCNANLRHSFTDGASTDVSLECGAFYGVHHWEHGFSSGQPIAVVVSPGHVTDGIDVTEHDGHGAKSPQTASGGSCRTNGSLKSGCKTIKQRVHTEVAGKQMIPTAEVHVKHKTYRSSCISNHR